MEANAGCSETASRDVASTEKVDFSIENENEEDKRKGRGKLFISRFEELLRKKNVTRSILNTLNRRSLDVKK